MKHFPLYIVFLSMFFAIFYANRCENGWVFVDNYCYQINTIPVKKDRYNMCTTYADYVPGDLREELGYSEIAWIRNGAKMALISINKSQNTNSVNGVYYSVCKKNTTNNMTLIIRKNVTFDDGYWIIPNALSIVNRIKSYMSERNYNGTVWIGWQYKINTTWKNTLPVSPKQSDLLNISLTGKTGYCGVYSLVGNFSSRNCSEYHNGLELTNTSLEVTTTEEITSTQPPTIQTSATEEITSPQLPTIQTSATEEVTSTQPPTIQTSDKTLTQTTSPENTTPTLCRCQCPKNLTRAEIMESAKEIKVKNTEVSKYRRSKTSAPDERTSSRAIGFVAVAIMAVPFGLILLSDIPILLQQLKQIYSQKKKIPKNGHRATLKV